MASAGGSQQSLRRKAMGVLKDSTKVGLAKVNSENKGLDVAIVKATKHEEVLPKEKHVRTILGALSASSHRSDVFYCINSLVKRLAKTHTWTVALKILIVVHRALREIGLTFHEELSNYIQGRNYMLNLSHFRDDSSPKALACSAWVRAYALYIEERLACYRFLENHINTDRLRSRNLDTSVVLEQLPALQQLMFCLLACQPEGAATQNSLIQYALSIVATESVKLYVTIADGILILVDKYFEMQRHDAVKALEIYRVSGNQAEKLSNFFEVCRNLGFGHGQQFIKFEQPPASFMTAMEDYLNEAPSALVLHCTAIKNGRVGTPERITDLLIDHNQDIDHEENPDVSLMSHEPPRTGQNEAQATPEIADLLSFDEITQDSSELEENNCLALAIFTSDNASSSGNLTLASQTTGWELALIASPSSNGSAVSENKLAGLDKLALDSLYDDAIARTNQNETYNMGLQAASANPFDDQAPFYSSSKVAPPTNVETANLAQEQFFMTQQQKQEQHQHQQLMICQDVTNPFWNPFLEQSMPAFMPTQNSYPALI